MSDVEIIRTGPSINKGKSKQDYGTPIAFIQAVEKRFGPLVADLACTRANAKAPKGYHFDDGMDSLAYDWADDFPTGNLWLNPPFADIAPWAAKCDLESNRHGLILLLTPASIGSNWFAQHVHGKAMVLGLAPRLTFEGTSDPYPKDLMLSVFGMGLKGFDVWRWDAPTLVRSTEGSSK
jgi:hypothetical protein